MTTNKSPKIGIVVLNYKNYGDTIECLDALFKITYPNTEIIVVDNDSQNDSLEFIHKHLAERQTPHCQIVEGSDDAYLAASERVILIQSGRNGGYSAGNNVGIRVALARSADYVLILNNDTLPAPGFLEPLVDYAEAHDDVGVVGPKVLTEDGCIDPSASRRHTIGALLFARGIPGMVCRNNPWVRRDGYLDEGYAYDHPREADVLCGCCLLIKKCILERTGLLDENTFLFLEEYILCEKLRAIAMKTAIVPEGEIVHKRHKSTSTTKGLFLWRVNRASRYYFFTQYRHWPRWAARLLVETLTIQESMLSLVRLLIKRNRPRASKPRKSDQ